ncbi:MAG TPA: site-specific integrase [Myxococcota bacterium]|nr:site-specific integrase [Myxococcota bacterium]
MDPEWYDFFLLALRSGLRLGELCALTWHDVDLAQKQVVVRRSWTRGHLTDPKGKRSRVVPLSQEVADALTRRRSTTKTTLVFADDMGGYLNRDKVKYPFWRLCRHAGVPLIRVHDLRHSFGSQLVVAGAPLPAVHNRMGHADIKTTMRYIHLAPAVGREWVGSLDAGALAARFKRKARRS